MHAYRTLVLMLGRSNLRDPVGSFFTLIFAPMLVVILGAIFGNDPSPTFENRGFIEATLPATASLVAAIIGVTVLPLNQLQVRESGALRRLQATPLRPGTYIAADLTVNFAVGLVGTMLAFLVGVVGFGVRPQGNFFLVLAAEALGLVAFLALGYTLSAIYPSAGAATGIGNGLMLTLVLTSGAFMPVSTLPSGVQKVVEYSPLQYLVKLTQGLWDGGAWSDYLVPTAVLIGMVVVFGLLGARLFKWNSR